MVVTPLPSNAMRACTNAAGKVWHTRAAKRYVQKLDIGRVHKFAMEHVRKFGIWARSELGIGHDVRQAFRTGGILTWERNRAVKTNRLVSLCAVKMGVYKIWDCSRQQKKCVCATTLEELKIKGMIKLLKKLTRCCSIIKWLVPYHCLYNQRTKVASDWLPDHLYKQWQCDNVYIFYVLNYLSHHKCTFICGLTASQKLGFGVIRIVLEEDGTEVDGDEELIGFAGATLMCLRDSELWSAVPQLTTNAAERY